MLALRVYTTKPPSSKDCVITRFPCSLGRSEKNDLQISDASISNHHAVIEIKPSGLSLRDLGSTNGVRLLERKVSELFLRKKMIFYLGNVRIEVLHVKEESIDTKTQGVPFEAEINQLPPPPLKVVYDQHVPQPGLDQTAYFSAVHNQIKTQNRRQEKKRFIQLLFIGLLLVFAGIVYFTPSLKAILIHFLN